MLKVAEGTLNEVDLVMWIVEATTFIGAGERYIIDQLKRVKTPIIVVINKIDKVSDEDVFKAIDTYKNACDFAEIVPVSALNGSNTDELIDTLLKYLPYGPQYYDEDTITDQPERQIVAELIREQALRQLDKEIPHGIAVVVDSMKERTEGGVWSATVRLPIRLLFIPCLPAESHANSMPHLAGSMRGRREKPDCAPHSPVFSCL